MTPHPTDAMSWRDGAFSDDTVRPPVLELPSDIDLDDLVGGIEPVHSIARLTAEKGTSTDLARFTRVVNAMPDQDTRHLIVRIATTQDPLTVWELHQELDRRGIPPALRWPANNDSPQMKLVTALADLAWFGKRNPGHEPLFKEWKRLFKLQTGCEAWLDKAYWLLMNMADSNLARQGTKALALDDAHRQELMMFPSSKMAIVRRALQPTKFAETRVILHSHAEAHQDKDSKYKPADAAERRAQLWRVSALSGHSPTATAKNWKLLTGEVMTRRMIPRRLDAIKAALKSWGER